MANDKSVPVARNEGVDKNEKESNSTRPENRKNLRFLIKEEGSAAPTSDARIAANQQNARRSTGPRTEQGKMRSSLNAVKHALSSKRVTLIGFEDPTELDEIYRSLVQEWRVPGPTVKLVLWELAMCFWRLRRTSRIEAALNHRAQVAAIQEPYRERPDRPEPVHGKSWKEKIADLEDELETVEKLICRVEATDIADLPACLSELPVADLIEDIDFHNRELLLGKLRLVHDRLNVEIAALFGDDCPSMSAHMRRSPRSISGDIAQSRIAS